MSSRLYLDCFEGYYGSLIRVWVGNRVGICLTPRAGREKFTTGAFGEGMERLSLKMRLSSGRD
jgi:hypothetical protein